MCMAERFQESRLAVTNSMQTDIEGTVGETASLCPQFRNNRRLNGQVTPVNEPD